MAATPRRRRAAAPRHRAAAIAGGRAARPGSCGVLALVGGVVFAARSGTFAAHSTSVFTTFGDCIAKTGNRSAVFSCITRPANDIRP